MQTHTSKTEEMATVDQQAYDIEQAARLKAHLQALTAKSEAERGEVFYSQSDVAVEKNTGKVYSREDALRGNLQVTGLRPGDHVYYRGAFGLEMAEHHGIYVGNRYMVEAWVNTSVDGYYKALASAEFRPGMVSARTVEEFTDNGSKVIFVREYSPDRTPKERMEAVHRALDAFGTRGYNLFRANCEHFVCEMVMGPQIIPTSKQIDSFIDKPIVLGKLCEDLVLDQLKHRDSAIYMQDAELFLKIYRDTKPTETDLGNLRSMALRYGVYSANDGTALKNMTRDQLLSSLRMTMLFNMAKVAPNVAGIVRAGVENMPVYGMRKRARV